MLKKLRHNQRAAAGYLTAVILLVAVMMATIIGAIVFFEFASGADDSTYVAQTWTGTGANNTAFYIPLSSIAGSDPSWNITVTGGAGAGTWYPAASSNYTYISANNTLKLNVGLFNWGNDTVVVLYYNSGHDSINSVIAYAVTVFAMMAIVPLIMVGGLMLRSLGFMGGGSV